MKINKRAKKGAVLLITTFSLALASFLCSLLAVFLLNNFKSSISSLNAEYEKPMLYAYSDSVYISFLESTDKANFLPTSSEDIKVTHFYIPEGKSFYLMSVEKKYYSLYTEFASSAPYTIIQEYFERIY